jgi:hypothetical protein
MGSMATAGSLEEVHGVMAAAGRGVLGAIQGLF